MEESMLTDKRLQQLMESVGLPNSTSLKEALEQVANEVEQQVRKKHRTPARRYMNDNAFRALVRQMESIIHRGQFTPSEVREAAIFACIQYEMTRPDPPSIIVAEVEGAFKVLTDWQDGKLDNKKEKVE